MFGARAIQRKREKEAELKVGSISFMTSANFNIGGVNKVFEV